MAPMTGDKVLMVQDRNTGKWGLPGGYAEPGERSDQTARRELWEETGIQALGPLRRVRSGRSSALFKMSVRAGSHRSRVQRFKGRRDRGETKDYAYVSLNKRTRGGEFVVTDFSGKRKSVNPTSFRRGTVSSLRALSRRRR